MTPEAIDKKKIGDMTVGELKTLIRNVVREAIDPDYGLELRQDVEKELKESSQSKGRIPVEEVAEKLGLKW